MREIFLLLLLLIRDAAADAAAVAPDTDNMMCRVYSTAWCTADTTLF